MDLTLRFLGDAANAQGAFKDLGSAATAAGAILIDFAKQSVKAFAEAERTQIQLRLAAGKYTEALNEQAESMKEKYAVDDDAIRHMDVLLLRYGAAPGAINGATEAVLNYAAATGKDATQAMEMLIRGVESGTGSLGKMGVHFQSTGKFSTDLANAVEALGKKFGGAGEADARSLDGRMRSVGLATDDLKKTFGAMFDEFDRRHSVLDRLAAGLNKVNDELKDEGLAVFLGLKRGRSEEKSVRENLMFDPDDPTWQALLAKAQASDRQGAELVGFLKSKGAIPSDAGTVGEALPMTSEADHEVGKDSSSESAAKKAQDEFERQLNAENEYLDKKWLMQREAEKRTEELLELELQSYNKTQDAKWLLAHKDEEKREEALHKQLEAMEKHYQDEDRLAETHQAEQDKRFKHMTEQWRSAGDRMGAALVDAIGEQLLRLAEGGDVDPAETAGNVVAVILGIAGFAIGTYFGAPQVGGAIGGLAGGLAKAGIVGQFGRKKKHDGGGIERFHDGGWPGLGSDEVPLIGQVGEHMLSRRDVANMGGPRGVEAAKRGGGQTVVINAIDSYSFQDQFTQDRAAGRGFFNAIRIGRGDLQPLFGGG